MAKKKTPPKPKKAKSSSAKNRNIHSKAAKPIHKNGVASGKKIVVKQPELNQMNKNTQTTMPPIIDVSDGSERTALFVGWNSDYEKQIANYFKEDLWNIKITDAVRDSDYKTHAFDLKDIEDESMNSVWCHHILQRYHYGHVARAFNEFKRVLKEDGVIYLTVPDTQIASTYIANDQHHIKLYDSPAGAVTPIDIVYGFQKSLISGNQDMMHRSLFSLKRLGSMLQEAGFSDVRVYRSGYILHASAYKHSYGSEKFVERVALSVDPASGAAPKAPASPDAAQNPKNDDIIKRNQQIDFLEREPTQWKPLGLKKK